LERHLRRWIAGGSRRNPNRSAPLLSRKAEIETKIEQILIFTGTSIENGAKWGYFPISPIDSPGQLCVNTHG
jgi:hypothetical protein